MSISDFIQGFIIGMTLIVAIGPQNLFVINQGLKKNYITLFEHNESFYNYNIYYFSQYISSC